MVEDGAAGAVEDRHVPGGAAAVATVVLPGDGAVLVDVTGPADTVTGVAATPRTPFHLCSVAKAKTVAAVVVLRLAARGVLGLHDDVRALVPVEVPGETGPTPWQLLAHRGRGFQGQVRWYPRSRGAAAVLVNCEPGVAQTGSVVGRRLVALAAVHGWA
ncbi:serine hydrolase domain-containing protein [Cellulomonas sp. HD19AZ1]|uniref:serine hydrolase domain-containing protein n=1 Tax=Cellulomonas sp. HD19AZ1 TaxID=2559593 RepID=UPI001430FF6C|nr:serine hydrolase domain-containing protein [Cellulomonas sp. HD19AZ1]